ncbi:MAG: glycerophosphodiester phosphodiesterase [Spirochaetes bacterium]|nr:glycerophosphodiester phosphodiesterase [Spirochaetota bacterium]
MKRKIAAALLATPLAAAAVMAALLLYHVVLTPPCGKRAGESGIACRAVIAHRGASHDAPEETAPAYILARDLGVDYLEMDVQRTADGVIVALHDDTLERTTNVKAVFPGREKNPVSSFTMAELRRLDAGSWFNGLSPDRARDSFAGATIPTLDEIIAIAEGGVNRTGLYIETKSPEIHPGIERELVRLLRRRGWIGVPAKRGRVMFQSFSLESLGKLAGLAPEIPRVYLVDEDTERDRGSWEALVSDARAAGSGIGPVGYLAYPWHTGPARRAGLLVHVYTINLPWQMRLITFFGADGLFTDRPDILLKIQGRGTGDTPASILARYGF